MQPFHGDKRGWECGWAVGLAANSEEERGGRVGSTVVVKCGVRLARVLYRTVQSRECSEGRRGCVEFDDTI